MPKKYLRIRDLVEQTNFHEETIRTWIRQKKLPAIRVGRDYLIDPDDWQKFLDSRRTDRKEDT
jgi:excisionase family DNA binding protein